MLAEVRTPTCSFIVEICPSWLTEAFLKLFTIFLVTCSDSIRQCSPTWFSILNLILYLFMYLFISMYLKNYVNSPIISHFQKYMVMCKRIFKMLRICKHQFLLCELKNLHLLCSLCVLWFPLSGSNAHEGNHSVCVCTDQSQSNLLH